MYCSLHFFLTALYHDLHVILDGTYSGSHVFFFGIDPGGEGIHPALIPHLTSVVTCVVTIDSLCIGNWIYWTLTDRNKQL
jgi:hypothetical protein